MNNTNIGEINLTGSTPIQTTLLNYTKLNLITLSTIPVAAAISIGSGYFSLHIHNTMLLYISASLFFFIPIVSILFIKQICVHPVTLFFTDTMLMISKLKTEITIQWDDVEGYRIRIIKGALAKGIIITFINKNKKNQSFCFADTKIADESGNLLTEGILYNLCCSLKSYNSQIDENYAVGIYPIPNPLNRLLFPIVSFLAVTLIIFDFCYRASHAQLTKSSLRLILVSIVTIISAYAIKARNKKLMKKIDDLYEGIILQ